MTLQKRYEGFLNTPSLWKDKLVLNLKQFEITRPFFKMNIAVNENLRLGKYVERLVSFQLAQQDNIAILDENIQIQNGKITVGELDVLLISAHKPIHLEVVYKFYLYDATVGNSELYHFIGPNRKDALMEKLTKLKTKQLPLLFSKACASYLSALGLKAEDMEQHVCFKAQLFVPFNNQNIILKTLNTNCIIGFYIKQNELKHLAGCKFYIPNKKDWLVVAHTQVHWLNFKTFAGIANDYFEQKFSPLCWIKFSNGELKKIFLVWW